MSKYTTEVRWICESKSGFSALELQNKSVDQIIDAAWTHIFDFNFNFYNNAWNEKIAKAVLKYYYTREIGLETVGLWKLKLNSRCMEIAGKYEPMIRAIESLTPEDYFSNYNFSGKNDRTDNLTDLRTDNLQSQRTDNLQSQRTDNLQSQRTDNLTRTRDGESKNKYSETPQNGLTSVENGQYLTDYRDIETDETDHDTGTQTTNNTGTQNVTDTGTQTTADTGTQNITHTGTRKVSYGETGYKGSKTLADYIAHVEFERLNITGQIIKEFSDLFFLLW